MKNQERNRRLLMERSIPGRVGTALPPLDVPPQPLPSEEQLRDDLGLPEVSEGEVVRYFTGLSQMNFSVDTNYYPLGSCTMKYNPKINDEVANLPGFSQIHPLQPPETVQGALKLAFQLQGFLSEIVGMEATSLATMAGAQGELAGMLMIRAYHVSRGDKNRKTVLVPDSAHGTNPASAAMCGYQVVSIPSDARGNMDVDALRQACNSETAGLMLTLPNTLGLFDTNILEICQAVHRAGGLVYGDGANMNAILGQTKLGHLGFDVLHINLHKTFSTPHGGGGPGAGPVCANSLLAPFLASPVVEKMTDSSGNKETYGLAEPERSIGKTAAFHGNFGMLVRAYTYIRGLGAEGLREISENAVINANYILNALKDDYHLPYDRSCMHEVVFSAKTQKAKGVSALDVAKRLIDYGIHPPTMYFPLIAEEALMIEPTETESKETLDYFIQVMKDIAREADIDVQVLKDAPHHTPNSRLDEARAARKPDVRWKPAEG
ncbi:MAG: aminomethyl-transferring glycine dehydrogenase subunit GcvPB [Dehalococcoidia bacterium]|nr:aminomethyl-transferring glycine dehydrogenase subunit GcvPB [Dehalococcoidia bacterium]